jgi:hypothetical protein
MKNSNLKNFGIAYILSATLVIIANFALYDNIFITGNFEETIKNLSYKEQYFRIAIFLDLLYVTIFTTAFVSLYTELKATYSHLALVALIMQLLYIFIFLAETMNVLEVFRLMNSQIHVQNPERFEQVVKSFMGFRFDRYYGGLPMHSIGSFIFSYLIYKTTIAPKTLSIMAMFGWVICTVCSFALFTITGFMKNVDLWLYDTISTLSFILLGGYFIFKFYKK